MPSDAVPVPRRIRIVGTSGSGKTRLAEQVAAVAGIPRLELDAVFWDADWQYRDLAEAHDTIRRFVAENPDGWVIDGNWTSRLDGLLAPGTAGGPDVVVWLDHARPVVMARVIRRTLRRGILREELWHGNRERPSSWLRLDPEENIIRWAWTQHSRQRETMAARAADGWPIVRLSGQRSVDDWRDSLLRH
ncbi:toxin [Microbacterium sp. zg-YB36]|uniref:toxin n=1 Tax=Microbacterium sp. zg-YB36 TaxID=2969407 RepID=UPI00214C9326|nr:toxin [Microbacterium sp. zg-YB36]MDL5351521.1 toxin [Microbacterium sp. zg-YB36]